jgi:TolB-like protein/Tfp pilus assembly protein PilF
MAASRFPLLKELRRRRVFRTAGLYVVGAWLLLQAANIVFPAWSIPDAAIRYLILAVLLGFPVALVFGWIFEITSEGIRRTRPVDSAEALAAALPLQRTDYLILSAFVLVVGLIVYDATGRVLRTAVDGEPLRVAAEIMESSVAVLPFASLSAEPEHEFFADGISEEILNRLAVFPELTVIARTSSFAFKNSGYDIARISRLLGVQYLLQGSIRRDDGQIRIAAQLVDHRGRQLWTQTFNRQPDALFALQDEIAEAVATNIVPQIVPPPARAREPDFEAYHHYMIGRELLTRRPMNFASLALERLGRAIELDAEFAEAYAERAIAWMFAAGEQSEEYHDRARQDIDKALALNPEAAQAYAAQALLDIRSTLEQRDLARRQALLRRAVELDPNHVNAMAWLAAELPRDEASELLQRTLRIDPLAVVPNRNVAAIDAEQGRFDDAERRLLRLLEVPRPSWIVYDGLIWLYVPTGRLAEALEMAKLWVLSSAMQGGPGAWELWGLTEVYGRLGMAERVEYWFTRAQHGVPETSPIVALYAKTRTSLNVGWPDPAAAVNDFRTRVDAMGRQVTDLHNWTILPYGILLALAGDYERAIENIQKVLDPESARIGVGEGLGSDGLHALAWAWLQTGAEEQAKALLGRLDRRYREMRAAGYLHLNTAWGTLGRFDYARNTLLLGETEQALDLLEEAADMGWRGYYAIQRDPRWDAVREHPRFVALMARVNADIERQRAAVEVLEAEDDFAARLDAVIAAREAEAGRP